MQRIDIELRDPAPSPDALLIVPVPFGHWNQRAVLDATRGLTGGQQVAALNAGQGAVIYRPDGTGPIQVGYAVSEGDYPAAPHVWEVQNNRYTIARSDLEQLARDIVKDANDENAKLHALMEYAAGMFGYDHPEDRFNDNLDSVPAVCGTTKGSCVDINTFLLAAARSVGIRGQYIAGYWFHPRKTQTHDMHCWLAFEADGDILFWDLAHHLKWGVDQLAPGLNPAGGRRVAMSCGRGLAFETPNGAVSISHFSEPVWILPGGGMIEPALVITVID